MAGAATGVYGGWWNGGTGNGFWYHLLTSNQRLEAGTPPIAQAIGLGCCCGVARTIALGAKSEHEARLMNQLFRDLNTISGLRTIGSLI